MAWILLAACILLSVIPEARPCFRKFKGNTLTMVEKPRGPVDEGDYVSIRCAWSWSNHYISWYRNWRMIRSASSSLRHTFRASRKDNWATYECRNSSSEDNRDSVTITVHFKPSKITMIQNPQTEIYEGNVFIIICETDSANPPADIQFFRTRGTNRERLTAGIVSHDRWAEYNGKSRTTTLARIASRSDNQAVFECQVRDGSFHLKKATTVTVYYKPDFAIVSSIKTSSHAGERERFTCNVAGSNPTPTPRIYLKRSGGTPVEVIQGQDRVMAKADNQAEFYCEAKVPGYPALDVTSQKWIYRVTFPFTKVSFINPTAAVEVGQVKMFTCETDESNLDGVTNTTWDQYVYGCSSWRLISTGKATPGRSGVYGGKIMVDRFNITATKAMHQSIVRCQFLGKDGHGQTLVSTITRMYVKWYVAELKMVEKPSGPVKAGATLKIKCETDSSYPGTPGPILWYREGRRITSGVNASSRPASDGGTISVSEVTFTVRKEDNQANYKCKINDQASFREDVNITVHFKPTKILMIHKPLTAIKEGKAFIITCTTDIANPAADIQFYRRRGTNRERLTKEIRSNGRTEGYGKIRTSSLVVTAGRTDNQAVFECQVREGSFHLEQATRVTVYH